MKIFPKKASSYIPMINIMTEVIKNKKKMCHLALFISISPTHKDGNRLLI